MNVAVAKPPLVRLLLPTDSARWLHLWQGYVAACVEQGIAAPPDNCTELNWSRLMAIDEPVTGLIAEVDGEAVGLLHLIFHRSTFHENEVCFLQDLFTVNAFRGKGIARALIQQAQIEATAKGARRIYWQTAQTNDAAILLYDKVATRTRTVNFRIAL